MQLTELERFLSGPKRQRRGVLLNKRLIRIQNECARKYDSPLSLREYQQISLIYSAVNAALSTLNYVLSEPEVSS